MDAGYTGGWGGELTQEPVVVMPLTEEVATNKPCIPRIKISLGKKKDNPPQESTVKPPNTTGKSPTELKRKIRDDHQIKCRARAKISKLENEVNEMKNRAVGHQ